MMQQLAELGHEMWSVSNIAAPPPPLVWTLCASCIYYWFADISTVVLYWKEGRFPAPKRLINISVRQNSSFFLTFYFIYHSHIETLFIYTLSVSLLFSLWSCCCSSLCCCSPCLCSCCCSWVARCCCSSLCLCCLCCCCCSCLSTPAVASTASSVSFVNLNTLRGSRPALSSIWPAAAAKDLGIAWIFGSSYYWQIVQSSYKKKYSRS